MKNHIVLLSLFFISLTAYSQNLNSGLSDSLEMQRIKNRQNSATWDRELMQRDISDSIANPKGRPFPHGAFPVPVYDLAGKFRYSGAGAGGNFKMFHDKILTYSFFFANKTEASKIYLGDMANETFFIFVMLTDYIDTVNYSHGQAYLLSRNNPDVTCEGYFRTKHDEVDFMAFLTPDRNEYAVVNMRLFNLKFGRVILIAPQKDHSLRSMQLSAPVMSNNEVDSYIDRILEQDDIKEFFLNSGSL